MPQARFFLRTRRKSLISAALGSALVAASCTMTGAPGGAGPAQLSGSEAARCEALLGKELGGARIEEVKAVRRGQAGGRNLLGSSKAPVPFCRVRAVGSAGPGSSIRMDVFLPAVWNGKLIGVGGGGLSGGLNASTGSLMRELARGYAGVANDAGHMDEKNAAWAVGAPAKIEDFGHRASHEATLAARAIAEEFYGSPVQYSYFSSCSNGGREAMMLAQRYPDDYDGIIATAPAINWTGLMAFAQATNQLYETTPGAARLPSKLPFLRQSVIEKCDHLDGVKDNVLENPLLCDFDPTELRCEEGKTGKSCLTQGELEVVKLMYAGPRAKDGTLVSPGFPVSSEYGKAVIPVVGWAPWHFKGFKAGLKLSTDFYRGVVTGDLAWDRAEFDLDRDYALAKSRVGRSVDALDPDLRPYAEHGGKLLLLHGWEDPAIPAGSTLQYYDEAVRILGPAAEHTIRLFMAPGMAHCSLGHGPDEVDLIPELDAWVTGGEAPSRILAEKRERGLGLVLGWERKTLRTRPLCPWPETAHYSGSGSTDDATNFTCR